MSISRVIGEDPSFEHNTTRTLNFQSITVRCRRACLRVEFTVDAVKCHEFPQICED